MTSFAANELPVGACTYFPGPVPTWMMTLIKTLTLAPAEMPPRPPTPRRPRVAPGIFEMFVMLLYLISFFLLPSTITAAPNTNDMQILLSWVQENGGIVQNINVGHSSINGAGRALKTIQSREKNDVLVAVPVHMLITDATARADPLIQRHVLSFNKSALSVDSCMTVTLYLLIETLISQDNSRWIKYFNSLPPLDHLFNLPQFEWNNSRSSPAGQAALEVLLTSPSVAARIHKDRRLHDFALLKLKETVFSSLKKDYPHLNDTIILKTYLWAKSNILTRSWGKAHSSIAGECTMVPVLDLLNHHDEGGGLVAITFDDKPDHVHSVGVTATKNVEAGSEVVDSYDPAESTARVGAIKCMQEMLLGFGFIPSNSSRPWCFDITLNVILPITFRSPTLNMLARNLLARVGTAPGKQYTTKLKENDKKGIPVAMLAVMRLLMSGEREMLVIQRRGDADRPLTPNHERRVLLRIHNSMEKNLASIPSSEKQDKRMLSVAKEAMDDKMAIALEVRLHERRICEQTIEHTRILWDKVMFDERIWE